MQQHQAEGREGLRQPCAAAAAAAAALRLCGYLAVASNGSAQ